MIMQTGRLRRFYIPLLVAVAIAALYGAASWSNQFVYDDHEVIENQYPIRHLNDLGRIFREPHYLNFPYYRPLTRSTFALQMSVSERNPRAYHIFNAVLAGAVMLAAYALLLRPAFGLSELTALLAASWFALHPAISECVYPAASGRETLLPALFIVLTMWAWLGRGAWWYCVAIFMLIAALLCKEQAAVMPGMFLLADLLGLAERPQNWIAWIRRYMPIVCIFVLYFFVRHLVFKQPTVHLTFFQHLLEPLKSLLYGVQTGVTPFMVLRYEPPFETWFNLRLSLVSCAAVILLIGIALAIGKRARLVTIFWIGWFVLLQLPTAHLVEQEAPFSERYAALAILALPAIAAVVASGWVWPKVRSLIAGIAIFWTVIFGCISFLRGEYYTDDASFCIQWQNTSPSAAGPHDGFGRLAQERQEFPTAIAEYQKALAIQSNDATARNNLANLLAYAGDFAGASQQYEWLLSHSGSGADPVATITNYAQLLGQEAFDRHDAAMRDRAHGLLEEAVNLRPDYAQSHYVLGLWNMAFGSRDAAIRQFKIALNLRPGWEDVEKILENIQKRPASSEASTPSTRP